MTAIIASNSPFSVTVPIKICISVRLGRHSDGIMKYIRNGRINIATNVYIHICNNGNILSRHTAFHNPDIINENPEKRVR